MYICSLWGNSIKHNSWATYRKLKNINVEQFKSDIYKSGILNDVTGFVDELMNKYVTGLTSLLDIHAPLIHRVITPRPNAPWYTKKLCESKRLHRCFKRK